MLKNGIRVSFLRTKMPSCFTLPSQPLWTAIKGEQYLNGLRDYLLALVKLLSFTDVSIGFFFREVNNGYEGQTTKKIVRII